MKVAVYTCITGNRCPLQTQQRYEGADFLFFTDTPVENVGGWQPVYLPITNDSARRRAKGPKILAHQYLQNYYLQNYDYSLWIDGNCSLLLPITDLLTYLDNAEIALFRSPLGDCVYEHATLCREGNFDDDVGAFVLSAQVQRYKEMGFPAHAGFYEGGVILRRHSERVRQWENIWWEEVRTGSVRDQISLPFALRQAEITPAILPGTIRNDILKGSIFFDYKVSPPPKR